MKIFKLFINENIKTWKKVSTKVLLIAILLSLVGVLALTKFTQHLDENNKGVVVAEDNSNAYLKQEIEYLKEELKNDDLEEQSRRNLQAQLQRYELYLEYNINMYANTWKKDIVEKIVELKQNKNDNQAEKFINILKEDNYSGYVQIQKQFLQEKLNNQEIEQQEFDDENLLLELKDKYGTGDNDVSSWKTTIIKEIEQGKKSIRTGINQNTGKVLTVEEKKKLEDMIIIDIYRLEHDIEPIEQGSYDNYKIRFESLSSMFIVAVISIVVIIIAGGTISSEISSGTIKFWALTPNKRWKIITAKLLSILFYITVVIVIMALLSAIVANVFFQEKGSIYLYTKNGEVKQIGNTLYTIELYLAKEIPVVMFALFAAMLSTITRNTGVSVSLSMALYMGEGIAMLIINQFIKKDWIRFVPFNNLDIADKIFNKSTSAIQLMANGSDSFATSTSLGFSLGVLGVCAILMLVTMYDSFNKRDII